MVATHIRLGPRIPDPEPAYDDVVEAVRGYLLERAAWATEAGLTPDRIVVDAGQFISQQLEPTAGNDQVDFLHSRVSLENLQGAASE